MRVPSGTRLPAASRRLVTATATGRRVPSARVEAGVATMDALVTPACVIRTSANGAVAIRLPFPLAGRIAMTVVAVALWSSVRKLFE